jgi:hypothetical protein
MTGIESVIEMLQSDIDALDWNDHTQIKKGTFLNGQCLFKR